MRSFSPRLREYSLWRVILLNFRPFSWHLSRTPLVAKCVALVPFRLKQSFKRRLSARPMHDIVYKE
jgi:hypothetical protein